MTEENKMAVKAIQLARMATQYYIEWNECGRDGPLEPDAVPELERIKAEADILIDILNEALARCFQLRLLP